MHQDGVVAEWHERGYGFIVFSDKRRAYVHHTSINSAGQGPIDLTQGELVKAVVVEDAQNPGKWAALDVQRKGLIQGGPPSHAVPQQPVMQQVMHVNHSSGGPMLEGVVTEWSSRGFGFILCQDGRRAYVHHTTIGGGNLLEGEAVSAQLVEDVKNPGKWAATNIQRSGLVEMDPPQAMPHMPVNMMPMHPQQQQQQQHHYWNHQDHYSHHQVADHLIAAAPTDMSDRIHCIVTEWSERGYGFIQTADGRRAYVHASAFGGGDLMKGETVNCIIVEDPQSPGKWQARALQRGPIYEARPMQRGPVYEASRGPHPAYRMMEDHGPPSEDGIVVEWRQEAGYGFLSMTDGRRVYIHHSSFGGGDLHPGQRLSVQTKPDPRNPGKWSVAMVFSDVHGCGGNCGGPSPGGGNGLDYMRHADPRGGAPIVEPRPPMSHNFMAMPMQTPRRQNPGLTWASVTEWDTKGFGFVITEDGRRVYVHHTAFGTGNLCVGERVAVTIIPDQRNPGKLMAQKLVRDGAQQGLAPQAHPEPQSVVKGELDSADAHFSVKGNASAPLYLQEEEEWVGGTVSEWHEDRGYGFIELEDGRRLYVHHTAFGGGSLVQGAPCEAIPVPDKVNVGKLSAASVRGDAAVINRASGGDDPPVKRSRAS